MQIFTTKQKTNKQTNDQLCCNNIEIYNETFTIIELHFNFIIIKISSLEYFRCGVHHCFILIGLIKKSSNKNKFFFLIFNAVCFIKDLFIFDENISTVCERKIHWTKDFVCVCVCVCDNRRLGAIDPWQQQPTKMID